MAEAEHSTPFRVLFAIVETAAIVVGLALTLFSLMAVVGQFTSNLWIRLGIAAPVALFVPFLLADRLLPKGERAAQVDGFVTDVLAACWLGFGFLFVVVAAPATGDALRTEAKRLSARGLTAADGVVHVLVGPAGQTSRPSAVRSATGAPTPEDRGGDAGPADAGWSDSAAAADAFAGADDASEGTGSDDDEESEEDKKSPGELFEQAAPAVVSIRIKKDDPRPGRGTVEGSGTGFFVDDGGVIATNNHVIDGAVSGEIKLWDGRKTEKIWVLATNERLDLALLEIDFDDLEGDMEKELPGDDDRVDPLELGDSDDVQVGQEVIAVGNPLGLEHTLTRGLVSQRRMWRGRKMIQVSVPLSPGNSGGPLINMYGKVVGVSFAKLGNAWNQGDSLNLAIPIGKLEDLMSSDYPDKHRLGEGDDSGGGTW